MIGFHREASHGEGSGMSGNRRVIHVSCLTHSGTRGFANLVVSKHNGEIVMDPHVTGQCVLTLAEDEAIALRDALTEWLG